jgi:peptide/nickel transport system ATP-binding protein
VSDAADPVLSLEDVSVHYSEESLTQRTLPDSVLERAGLAPPDPVRAVDDVTLDLAENDVLCIVGESGSGKTTLGKTAVGLQRPTDGTVRYRGQDVWEAKANPVDADVDYEDIRRSLQIIHQDPGASLNPYRKVKKNLSEPLKRWQPELDRADRRERIVSLLERTGVTPAQDYMERYPHELSGGEQQRVVLVRTLLMEPDVVLADEAVSALDVSLRVEILDLMHDLQDEFDTAFLFVSHNLSDARYLAHKSGGRIAVMYLGEVVEVGPAEEVIQNPRHPYTKLLRWASTDIHPGLVEEGLHEPIPVRELDIPDARDVPSGCRFHNRCPHARPTCQDTSPPLYESADEGDREAACFRLDDDHDYWGESPLDEDAAARFEDL